MVIDITVPGEPVAKERPATYVTRAGKIRRIAPPRTRAWEEEVAWRIKQVHHAPPDEEGNFVVCATFSIGARDKDVDNLLKAVLDAGNGVVWKDDRQVVTAITSKRRFSTEPFARILIFDEGAR